MALKKLSKTRAGSTCLVLSLRTIVTKSNFAAALAGYTYDGNEIDYEKLSKKKAEEILRSELQWYGRSSRYHGSHHIGDEHQEEYNAHYDKAHDWVSENFPQLTD